MSQDEEFRNATVRGWSLEDLSLLLDRNIRDLKRAKAGKLELTKEELLKLSELPERNSPGAKTTVIGWIDLEKQLRDEASDIQVQQDHEAKIRLLERLAIRLND